MARIKFSLSPLFILFAFVVIYFGWIQEFLTYLVVMLFHEMAHYVVALCYGYRLNKIIFMPYGVGLSGDNNIFKPSHEIIIALAGPIFNVLLVLALVSLWWLYPITYAYTDLFVSANLVLGIFNLLPIFPLDGGRVLVAIFTKNTSKLKAYKIMKIIGLIFSAIFSIMFITSVFYKINLTLFFIALFLAVSSFTSVRDVYYERTFIKKLSNIKNVKPIEVKTLAVNSKVPLIKLVKFIKGNNYTQFLIVNDEGNIVKTVTEIELLNYLNINKKTNT